MDVLKGTGDYGNGITLLAGGSIALMPLALPISRRCRSATLQIGKHSGTLGIMISGFDQASETIDLTRIGADGAITNADTATDQITVTGSLCSLTLQRLDRRP